MLLQQEVSNVRAHHSLEKVYDSEGMMVKKLFQVNIQYHILAFICKAPFIQGVLYKSYQGGTGG